MNDDKAGEGGFLSRWSRRKVQVQKGAAPADVVATPQGATPQGATVQPHRGAGGPPAVATPVAGASVPTVAAGAPQTAHDRAHDRAHDAALDPAASRAAGQPAPTLQDIERLDANSDYRAFVSRDVDPDVRNAAFKKLFHSDPHFNVMDGLDVYIDDYNTPNPLPVSIMKTLVQARAMGLIDDELKEQEPPPPGPPSPAVAAAQAEVSGATDEAAAVEDAERALSPPQEPPLAELQLVPDTACNDERLSPLPGETTAEGTVVPFPRRPGSADPA